jgi:hypothetical protein
MSKALQSKAFPNAYLRIDGTGVSAPNSGGGGTVNCQSGVADFETIEERPQPDGTIAFASVSFPNVFLRMDGSGVKSASDTGAGTVNCQFGVGPWEKFHKRAQSDGAVAFESAAFPGVYLRMDAQGVGEFGSASGTGSVNCQFGVGPWERFLLVDPPFSTVRWQFVGGPEASATPAPILAADPTPSGPPHDVSVNPQSFSASDYDSDYLVLTDTNHIYSPDYGNGINTADFDFVATSSIGTSANLGVSQQLETENSQVLEKAIPVEPEETRQDPDQGR